MPLAEFIFKKMPLAGGNRLHAPYTGNPYFSPEDGGVIVCHFPVPATAFQELRVLLACAARAFGVVAFVRAGAVRTFTINRGIEQSHVGQIIYR